MNAAARVGAFGVVLALALGGGAAGGGVAGPQPRHNRCDSAHGGHEVEGSPSALAGLKVSELGYTLVPEATVLSPGTNELRFHITGPDGEPVTRFAEKHTKELHLIVVSRDLSHFAHVHPERDSSGTWSVDVPDLPPDPSGVRRLPAEDGPALTLGVDAVVPGDYEPPDTAPPNNSARRRLRRRARRHVRTCG
jgi:hypothetical protein